MSDFDLSLAITADGSDAVREGERLERAVDSVSKAETRAVTATSNLTKANAEAARQSAAFQREIDKLLGSIDPAAAAQKRLEANTTLLDKALGRGLITSKQYADGIQKIGAMASGQRGNLSNFGQQLQDVSIGLQSGTRFSTIFAQQAGQVAFALEGAGGVIGRVATFLSGPWGAAAILATGLAIRLGESFFESGENSKKAAKDIEDQAKALDKLGEAQKRQLRSAGQQFDVDQAPVIKGLQAQQKEVDVLNRKLAEANANVAKITANPKAIFLANQGRYQTLAEANTIAGNLAAQQRAAVSKLNVTQATRANSLANFSGQLAEDRSGERAAIEARYKNLILSARQLAATTGDYQKEQETIKRLNAAKEKELKAVQDSEKATRATSSGLSGRIVNSTEAASIARAAGFSVSSGDRTYAQQKALFDNPSVNRPGNPVAKPGTSAHERGAALDIRFGSGVTPQSIRKAYADEGVAITKLIKEAGHYHVEFKRNTEANQAFAKAQRDAAQEAAQLKRDLESTLRVVDPAAAQTAKYAEQLERIATLKAKGILTPDQAADYTLQAGIENFDAQQKLFDTHAKELFSSLGDEWSDALNGPITDGEFKTQLNQLMVDNGKLLARTFKEGLSPEALQAGANIFSDLGNLFGGKGGQVFGSIGSLFQQSKDNPGLAFGKDVTKLLGKNGGLGLSSKSAEDIGKNVGKAFGGAQFGATLNQALAPIGKALGVKTSKTGAQIGGAIGSLSGIPGGNIIGSVIGSVFGGLFKKTPTGSAVITGQGSNNVTTSGKLGSALAQDASTVQGGVKAIADALGGQLGDFLVSIGKRGDYFRVSGTGASNLGAKKTGQISGLLYDGKDEQEAIRIAILNAIADGGVKGISAAMQRALNSTTDLDAAVAEALKVREVEDIIGGLGATMKRQFDAFEAQAKERVRVATEYGFDVVKIEEKNASDRKALLDKVLKDSIGPLQALLDDLNTGDLFEGSAVDQRTALIAKLAGARNDVANGVDGSAQTLADLERQILEVSKNAYGTAGDEYASDLATARADAERAIADATKRAQDAQDQATGLLNAANSQVTLANEANDIAAQQLAALQQLVALGGVAAVAASIGATGGSGTNRSIDLRVANL